MPGTQTCIGGALQCVGERPGPTLERCDGATTTATAPSTRTSTSPTTGATAARAATTASCPNAPAGLLGRRVHDCVLPDRLPRPRRHLANGCEYACDLAGAEVCNGRDDDCDGTVDEALSAPPSLCNPNGVCTGTVAACDGCCRLELQLRTPVSTDADGDSRDRLRRPRQRLRRRGRRGLPVPSATRAPAASACAGPRASSSATRPETAWCATRATPAAGAAEVCNGLDDDCDGTIDDGAPDAWVQINAGRRWVYQYEASRPDATGASPGSMSHRPCSAAGRLPWTSVTHPQAEAPCAAVGARLCSEAEWQSVCRSSSGSCTWSYRTTCTTYNGNRCNGNDFDFDSGTAGDQDGLLAGGSRSDCRASWPAGGVFDISGNVKEWTLERSSGVNPLRGGSYNNTACGISCRLQLHRGRRQLPAPQRRLPLLPYDGALSRVPARSDVNRAVRRADRRAAAGGARRGFAVHVVARDAFDEGLLRELYALASGSMTEPFEHFALHAETNDERHVFRSRASGRSWDSSCGLSRARGPTSVSC